MKSMFWSVMPSKSSSAVIQYIHCLTIICRLVYSTDFYPCTEPEVTLCGGWEVKIQEPAVSPLMIVINRLCQQLLGLLLLSVVFNPPKHNIIL